MNLVRVLTLVALAFCLTEPSSAHSRIKRALHRGSLKFRVRANYRSNGKVKTILFRCSVLEDVGSLESLVIKEATNNQELGRITSNQKNVVYPGPFDSTLKLRGAVECRSESADRCHSGEFGYIFVILKDIKLERNDNTTHRQFTCDVGRSGAQPLTLSDTIRMREVIGSDLENAEAKTSEMFLKMRANFRDNGRVRSIFTRCSAFVDIDGAWDSIVLKDLSDDSVLRRVDGNEALPSEKIGHQHGVKGSLICKSDVDACNPGETGFLEIFWDSIVLPKGSPAIKNYMCTATKGGQSYSVDASVRVIDEGDDS